MAIITGNVTTFVKAFAEFGFRLKSAIFNKMMDMSDNIMRFRLDNEEPVQISKKTYVEKESLKACFPQFGVWNREVGSIDKNFYEIQFPSVREGTLPWAISFFFNEKKIDILCLIHIALCIKVIYWIQILLKKNIFYTVFLTKLFFWWAKSIFDSPVLLRQKV